MPPEKYDNYESNNDTLDIDSLKSEFSDLEKDVFVESNIKSIVDEAFYTLSKSLDRRVKDWIVKYIKEWKLKSWENQEYETIIKSRLEHPTAATRKLRYIYENTDKNIYDTIVAINNGAESKLVLTPSQNTWTTTEVQTTPAVTTTPTGEPVAEPAIQPETAPVVAPTKSTADVTPVVPAAPTATTVVEIPKPTATQVIEVKPVVGIVTEKKVDEPKEPEIPAEPVVFNEVVAQTKPTGIGWETVPVINGETSDVTIDVPAAPTAVPVVETPKPTASPVVEVTPVVGTVTPKKAAEPGTQPKPVAPEGTVEPVIQPTIPTVEVPLAAGSVSPKKPDEQKRRVDPATKDVLTPLDPVLAKDVVSSDDEIDPSVIVDETEGEEEIMEGDSQNGGLYWGRQPRKLSWFNTWVNNNVDNETALSSLYNWPEVSGWDQVVDGNDTKEMIETEAPQKVVSLEWIPNTLLQPMRMMFDEAKNWENVRYKFGGQTMKSWIDCSAFVSRLLAVPNDWQYKRYTTASLPSICTKLGDSPKKPLVDEVRAWDLQFTLNRGKNWKYVRHVEMIVGKPWREWWKWYVNTLWSAGSRPFDEDWNPIAKRNWWPWYRTRLLSNNIQRPKIFDVAQA